MIKFFSLISFFLDNMRGDSFDNLVLYFSNCHECAADNSQCEAYLSETGHSAIAIRLFVVVKACVVTQDFLRIAVLWLLFDILLSIVVPHLSRECRAADISFTFWLSFPSNVIKVLPCTVVVLGAHDWGVHDIIVYGTLQQLCVYRRHHQECRLYRILHSDLFFYLLI